MPLYGIKLSHILTALTELIYPFDFGIFPIGRVQSPMEHAIIIMYDKLQMLRMHAYLRKMIA